MLTLVLGGTRSGKSEFAERLAMESKVPCVSYVAAGGLAEGTGSESADGDWIRKVETHRQRRPASWITIEVVPGADLAAVLEDCTGTILVDSLGPWLAGVRNFVVDIDALVEQLTKAERRMIVVSDEVGLGVHPQFESGRQFREALGVLNRRISSVATNAYLVVAGRVNELGPVI